MSKTNKTVTGGTMTTKGFVKHLKHSLGFFMPVKLKMSKTITNMPRPPLTDENGFLIFALPGGGEFNSSKMIEKSYSVK